jgi:hypothetical protein
MNNLYDSKIRSWCKKYTRNSEFPWTTLTHRELHLLGAPPLCSVTRSIKPYTAQQQQLYHRALTIS